MVHIFAAGEDLTAANLNAIYGQRMASLQPITPGPAGITTTETMFDQINVPNCVAGQTYEYDWQGCVVGSVALDCVFTMRYSLAGTVLNTDSPFNTQRISVTPAGGFAFYHVMGSFVAPTSASYNLAAGVFRTSGSGTNTIYPSGSNDSVNPRKIRVNHVPT
jgi:hypothetical protein